jgi:hypothetical protein
MVSRYYLEVLQDETELYRKSLGAGDTATAADLAPLVQKTLGQVVQLNALPTNITNRINSDVQSGDLDRLRADNDALRAYNDTDSVFGATTPSIPPPQLYNQSNTAALQNNVQATPQQQPQNPGFGQYGQQFGLPPGGASYSPGGTQAGFAPTAASQSSGAPQGTNQPGYGPQGGNQSAGGPQGGNQSF